MRKLLYASLLVFSLSLAFWPLPAGQIPSTAALFGPEVFVRSTGKPIVETWHLSTTCFDGPFTLHVRNGDSEGKKRVSSAEVWLDRVRLLGPSDFSQKVSGYDIPVTLLPESILEVILHSDPGSNLEIWIEGTQRNPFEPEYITVLPSGGRYQLSNGIKLDIPLGAVSEMTILQFRRYQKEEIEPILNGPGRYPRDIMSAFSMEPPGFIFQRPISISLPWEPRPDPTSIPFVFDLNLVTGDLRPGLVYGQPQLMTDIPEAGTATEAAMGPYAGDAGIQATEKGPYTKVDCEKKEFTIVDLSTIPGNQWIKVQTWIDRVLNASDCYEDTCRCCKFTVRVHEAEISSDACHNMEASGSISYEACGGGVEDWYESDETVKDILFEFTPDLSGCINIGDELKLEVWAIGQDDERLNLPIKLTFLNDYLSVERQQNVYLLKAVKGGVTTIQADAGCDQIYDLPAVCIATGESLWRLTWQVRVVGDFTGTDGGMACRNLSGGVRTSGRVYVDGLIEGEAVVSLRDDNASKVISLTASGHYFYDHPYTGEVNCPDGPNGQWISYPLSGRYTFDWHITESSTAWLRQHLSITKGADPSYVRLAFGGDMPGYYDPYISEHVGGDPTYPAGTPGNNPSEGILWLLQPPGMIPASDGSGNSYYLLRQTPAWDPWGSRGGSAFETWTVRIEKII